MCHLSMKLSDMFDPNPKYNFDKIVIKHISVKETAYTEVSQLKVNNNKVMWHLHMKLFAI